MSIHIKELNVTLHLGESGGAKPSSDDTNEESNTNADCCSGSIDHAAVVEDTVKEVMRILKEKNER